MIRKYIAIMGMSALIFAANAQTFTDNFDSYTAGSFLGAASGGKWTTWTSSPGGSDDVKVSAVKAHSGSNSVYYSSVASTGGPVDCVLPFGGQLNTGTFDFTMWMFVETGKSAYFNWQEQSVVGKGWTFDLDLDAAGILTMVNTTGGVLLSSTYAQNQWFKLRIKVDLNTNTWEVFIDDNSKGTFQNTYRQIAAMDIFPKTGNGFYIDDVSYTYTPFTKPSTDATVTYIDNVLGFLAGTPVVPVVEIRNLGTTTITSADVELTYSGNTQTKKLTGLNIASLATYSFKLDQPVVILSGSSQISATVTQVNGAADADNTNNTKTLVLNPIVPAAGKMVIAEEATGTWCGWCPRGAVMLKNMHEKYPGFFQGIAVHNNDTMMNGIYDGGLASYISGYPSALVDRNPKIDPSAIEGDFMTRIMILPHGVFRVGAKYKNGDQVQVCVTTRFVQNISGNYKIAVVLTEDSITGKGTKFNQANYYSGGGSGVMGGFETKSNPVPAAQMIYDHVGRAIAPSFKGLPNAYGTSKNTGDSVTLNFLFDMRSYWNPKRMHIVPMLIDPNGKIDNGFSIKLTEALNQMWESGAEVLTTENLAGPDDMISVYPNPSTGNFTVSVNVAATNLKVYDCNGRTVYSTTAVTSGLSIPSANWAAGVYMVQVQTTTGVQTVRWVKQ